MAPAAKPGADVWIVSTSLDKPDTKTRRMIRSHAMRGRNTRTDRRARELAKSGVKDRTAEQDEPWLLLENPEWLLTHPRSVASDIAFFGYQSEVKPQMLGMLYRAFTVIIPSFYQVERNLLSRSSDVDYFCFGNLIESPAMIHVILFTSQAMTEYGTHAPGKFGTSTRYHLHQTLHLLQRSLEDTKTATKVTTMSVIASLATVEMLVGNLDTAMQHIHGLRKLVELAGDLSNMSGGDMINLKARKLEFSIALITGVSNLPPPKTLAWNRNPSLGGEGPVKFPELDAIEPRPGVRLLNLWADLRAFAAAANQATAFGMTIPRHLFNNIVDSAPSRLACLEDSDATSMHELLRLVMTTFMKTVLVTTPGLGPRLTYLYTRVKAALQTWGRVHNPNLDKFLFWALFIVSIAVFEGLETEWVQDMLRERAASANIKSWDDANRVLKQYLWLDAVLGPQAENLYYEWLGGENTRCSPLRKKEENSGE